MQTTCRPLCIQRRGLWTDCGGLTENAGHENDGPSKLQDMKLQDMKMTHQYVGHKSAQPENAGHENAGHKNAGHEIAGQNHVRPTLHYYEVCISCLLLLFS